MGQAWEPWAAAAFAPIAVWVLWRLQILSVELLRWRLVKLAGWRGTRWLYSIVSWFGVFLHELSHASVLLLSGHGVKQFRAGVEQGHVLPTRMRRGPIAFLSFLLAALAPLFIPPALVLGGLLLLVDPNLLGLQDGGAGLQGAVDVLRHEFVDFPAALARALAGLDLAAWPQAVVFALVLVGMPSSRPSHIKGSRFHGTSDEGDVAVLRSRIRQNPFIFIAFLAVLYAAYFAATAVAAASRPYWFAFEVLWAIALTGIVLAVAGAVWWTLTGLMARTIAPFGWLGPLAFVASQVVLRAPHTLSVVQVNGLSVAIWAGVALALLVLLPRRRG
ncbi:MAG: hypothetical protein V4510_09305 [bacterium]